jgi:hypothetical protein
MKSEVEALTLETSAFESVNFSRLSLLKTLAFQKAKMVKF